MIGSEYREWLSDLKSQIKRTQIKASISVNSQLIMLYWDLGRQITEKQETAKWGSGFIEQLSRDLRMEFPEMTAFSRTNIIAQRYLEITQQLISDHYGEIISTQNLIIDVRGNRGGNEGNWATLLPFLYTESILQYHVEIRATPLNIHFPFEEDTSFAELLHRRFNVEVGDFVAMRGQSQLVSFHTVYVYPQNIGIIIDGRCGSATELFLLVARQSSKVKLFGETTLGAIDTGSQFMVDSLCGELRLQYSQARFTRVPETLYDDIGIQPDFFIDSSVPSNEWVGYVSEMMSGW